MREKIYSYLTKPIAVVSAILFTATLILINGNIGYFFGLLVALLALWGSKFRWSEFGIDKPPFQKTIVYALLYAVLIFIVVDICIQPFIEFYLGAIDLSSLNVVRGSLINYLFFILIMWVFAAFGEEFIYRGFFMKRIAMMLGNTNKDWLISAFVISVLFGIAHHYQGISGMITTGLTGFCFSLVFYKNRNNLTIAIFTHGFYDMIGMTLIYLNQERVIIDWIQQIL
jgi:membrane protease YdiL (CAAX protease family)